jgi:hypothetical protein
MRSGEKMFSRRTWELLAIGFLHAFYQEILYERALIVSRFQLHHRAAERQGCAYGEHTSEARLSDDPRTNVLGSPVCRRR